MATGVEGALKSCARAYGWTWDAELYITAYSFRVTCCSYLYEMGASETRIKRHMGWELSGKKWFEYLRDVKVNADAKKLFGHVLP